MTTLTDADMTRLLECSQFTVTEMRHPLILDRYYENAMLSPSCLKALVTELQQLRRELEVLEAIVDPPVCRLQFPDGSVPGNAKEAAEGWKSIADNQERELVYHFKNTAAIRETLLERDAEIARLRAANAVLATACVAASNHGIRYAVKCREALESVVVTQGK